MKKKPFLLMSTALLALSGSASAQSIGPATLNATGGQAVVAGNTYEWSMGEMGVVSTNAAGNIVVTHGVLQPLQSSTGIAAVTWLDGHLSVYPNPATDVVYLSPSLAQGSALSYRLTDVAGKLILQQDAVLHNGTEQQTLSVSSLAAGTYFLQVSATRPNGVTAATAFKIQKDN